jgi:hypothetical protein
MLCDHSTTTIHPWIYVFAFLGLCWEDLMPGSKLPNGSLCTGSIIVASHMFGICWLIRFGLSGVQSVEPNNYIGLVMPWTPADVVWVRTQYQGGMHFTFVPHFRHSFALPWLNKQQATLHMEEVNANLQRGACVKCEYHFAKRCMCEVWIPLCKEVPVQRLNSTLQIGVCAMGVHGQWVNVTLQRGACVMGECYFAKMHKWWMPFYKEEQCAVGEHCFAKRHICKQWMPLCITFYIEKC